LTELEDLSCDQSLEHCSINYDKDDVLLQPSSSFKLILNLQVLLGKAKTALAGCGHNMQLLNYKNTAVEFKCLLCEISDLGEQCDNDELNSHDMIDDPQTECIEQVFEDKKADVKMDQKISDDCEKLLMSDIGEDEVELVKYEIQTSDELLEEDENSNMDMFYPDVQIHDDDDPAALVDATEDDVEIIEEPFGENKVSNKLEMLAVSGAISISKVQDNVASDQTNTKKTSKRKIAKVPMWTDPNLPEGWKREIVEKVSEKGTKLDVKIFGEGRVFHRKQQLKKFLECNKSISIDVDLVDFSVFGRNPSQ